MKNSKELVKYFGLTINNMELVEQSLTHSSYANEFNLQFSNERLEFVGDAVVDLLVGKYLFNEYKTVHEGVLTKKRAQAVCEAALANYARTFNLGDYIKLGKGEEKAGARNRNAILADAFEAFLGAIFLDQGIEFCEKILEKVVYPNLDFTAEEVIDYKSILQESVQADKRSLKYSVIKEVGPAHDKVFTAEVRMDNDIVLGIGTGKKIKEAEQQAAKIALDKLAKLPNGAFIDEEQEA